ncbi:hypothetical protein [Methylobacterium sp. CM6247]
MEILVKQGFFIFAMVPFGDPRGIFVNHVAFKSLGRAGDSKQFRDWWSSRGYPLIAEKTLKYRLDVDATVGFQFRLRWM